MKDFNNKVVAITGAGSGIGRALAQDFAKRGAILALNDYKADTLQETVDSLGPKVQVFASVFDVSKEADMQQFARDIMAKFGRVDVMINNAGVVQESMLMSDVKSEDFEWVLGINLWGVIYGTRTFLPYLRQQKESSLVNISSVFGLMGVPGVTSYCVSKFAVRGLSESILLEERIKKSGVAVSCVHPGGIKTNIVISARRANSSEPVEQEKSFRTEPSFAANVIIRGIQKKKSRILIGADAHVIHFLSRFARGFLNMMTIRMMKTRIPQN